MRCINVNLKERSYPIAIGRGLLDRLQEFVTPLAPTSTVIVTNDLVAPLYARRAHAALSAPSVGVVALPDGEQHKRWAAVSHVLDSLVKARVDRRGVIIALGGGVVGDIAGFAASIYLRGIRYVQVPTTLLAQVDSSVGGKTGINHEGGKNLIGAFHQPSAVVSDTDTLQTLPARELSAGLAEILKHGLIADSGYFERMVASLQAMRVHDASALADAIGGSCEIKASIVARDEHEAGERAQLNLGHTFGHAIEAMTGYSRWLHGEAVGCGLVLAAELSRLIGSLAASDVKGIETAVERAGLPTHVDGLSALDAIEMMRSDKKADAGQVRFIVLDGIGRATQRTVPQPLVLQALTARGFV
ncbi:MAG TPA: 3-dehydroquinate synthase [Burkholderiaceae bacterium]|nr:3-dehydroquinate synthase [Burkholderiaceae bacterium]